MNTPKISIITPCYNHAPYLQETIESVLGQGYPNLEYIIMDGGSTDGSVDIIRRFEHQLAYWTSGPDTGMYNAINLGTARATGDILGWLNSDDFYLPGTLQFVSEHLNTDAPELSFGNAFHFVQGRAEQWGSDVEREHASKSLAKYDYIIQPAALWTRRAWELTGALDESFQIVADWEWFARAQKCGVRFLPHSRYDAVYRITTTNKTSSGGGQRLAEMVRILCNYAGNDYAQVFNDLAGARDRILPLRHFLRKWHLARLERPVFRVLYPRIFAHVTLSDAWDMVELIGYS